jgi:hypothetical protein
VTVAQEGGDPTEGGDGTFRITRSNNSGDLTVNYTVGGTATGGTDFTTLAGSATITSGKYYVDVTVATLADNLVEGDEGVTITPRLLYRACAVTSGNVCAGSTVTPAVRVISQP